MMLMKMNKLAKALQQSQHAQGRIIIKQKSIIFGLFYHSFPLLRLLTFAQKYFKVCLWEIGKAILYHSLLRAKNSLGFVSCNNSWSSN